MPHEVNVDLVQWAGSQATDPVRRRMLQSLAQRAAAQPPGALREHLIAKLQQRAQRPPVSTSQPPRPALRNPVAELRALLPQHASDALQQVQLHQSTWRRLRVAHSLAELHAPVTAPLGPLNGQALATRLLQQLQALAPDYLVRVLTHMNTVSALEQWQAAASEAEKPNKPARPAKKKAAERGR